MSDNAVNDINAMFALKKQTQGLDELAEEVLKKGKDSDIPWLKTKLSTKYFEKYPDENANDFLAKFCQLMANTDFSESGPNITVANTPNGEIISVFQRKAKTNNKPVIVSVLLAHEESKPMLLDLLIEEDKKPGEWSA